MKQQSKKIPRFLIKCYPYTKKKLNFSENVPDYTVTLFPIKKLKRQND